MQEVLAGLQESGGEGFVGILSGVERGGERWRGCWQGESPWGVVVRVLRASVAPGVEPASKIGRRSCQPCRAQCGTGPLCEHTEIATGGGCDGEWLLDRVGCVGFRGLKTSVVGVWKRV